MTKPNVVFLFADQMRAQATGYAGDPNVQTPYLDRLAGESVNLANAVSNCPICTPYRASLLSGQYPLTHGLFMNDLCLPDNGNSLAQVLRREGYDTAYIGKWHLDGHGRSAYIPPERRQGFDYWKVLECTHDYNHSHYYAGNSSEQLTWPGYDAFAQTDDAVSWLQTRGADKNDNPFFLVVSYGTPHNPYSTAPEEYKRRYDPERLALRDNVPPQLEAKAREDLVGYYAHITALDECVRRIDDALAAGGMRENTIFVFTSDHGDSMESNCDPRHPGVNKQRPYEESIMVPFLLRAPGIPARREETLIGAPDIMPTLLDLCGAPIPETVEGLTYAPLLRGESAIDREAVLIANYAPFADWRVARGGREFRGVRTRRYTYAGDVDGPWLLFDNEADPYQLTNLVDAPEARSTRDRLETLLAQELEACSDPFLPAAELRAQWGYEIDAVDAIPYTN